MNKESQSENPQTKLYETEFGLLPFELPLDEITDEMHEYYMLQKYEKVSAEKIIEFTRENPVGLFQKAYDMSRYVFGHCKIKDFFTQGLIDRIKLDAERELKEEPEYAKVIKKYLMYLEIGELDMGGVNLAQDEYYRNARKTGILTDEELISALLRDRIMFRSRAGIDLQPDDIKEKLTQVSEITDQKFLENHIKENGRYGSPERLK
jgi:hypothetical protein